METPAQSAGAFEVCSSIGRYVIFGDHMIVTDVVALVEVESVVSVEFLAVASVRFGGGAEVTKYTIELVVVRITRWLWVRAIHRRRL